MPRAMALVAELMHSDLQPGAKGATLLAWDRVLGLDLDRKEAARELPPGAGELLQARERARADRDFAKSDELRDRLAGLGVTVIDTPDGQHIKR